MMLNSMIIFMSASILLSSCKKETIEEKPLPEPKNEVEGLILNTTFNNDKHTINLYTSNGKLQTGYNNIYFQIKSKDGNLQQNATVKILPMMHMTGMSHSCPISSISKKQGTSATYMAGIVFQMASNDMEYWELTFNYTIDGVEYNMSGKVVVEQTSKKTYSSFMGSDSVKYVVAMTEPVNPKIGINDMKAVLYKMKDMNTFEPVGGYTIKIDPRMPDMGNHTSPNNTALIGDCCSGEYAGKVNFTMSGYWKINLIIEDADNNVIKGEKIEGTVKSSSIFFELVFN